MKFGTEKEAALQQGWHKETHWWIKGPKDGMRGAGDIFDVTVNQYPDPYPYVNGHNTGFMQPQQKPSKRAQVVIDRIAQKLGKNVLETYKKANIERFKASKGEYRPKNRSLQGNRTLHR